jgi:hypothetical protein
MALYRQGEARAAQTHLAEGAKLLKQHIPDLTWFPMSSSQYNHDWLIAWLLHREAETSKLGFPALPQGSAGFFLYPPGRITTRHSK